MVTCQPLGDAWSRHSRGRRWVAIMEFLEYGKTVLVKMHLWCYSEFTSPLVKGKNMPDHGGNWTPTTFRMLAQCSINWAKQSGRFEYVIFKNWACSSFYGFNISRTLISKELDSNIKYSNRPNSKGRRLIPALVRDIFQLAQFGYICTCMTKCRAGFVTVHGLLILKLI